MEPFFFCVKQRASAMLVAAFGDCRISEQFTARVPVIRISGWINKNLRKGEKRKVERNMNETKVYADSYCAVFREQKDFLECIRSRMENSCWDRRKSKTLRLAALTEESPIAD